VPVRRLLALLLLLSGPALAREKSDLVVMVNGDHIHGEIKGMSRGKLDFNTEDVGRISVEWLKVVRISSTHTYEVTLTDFRKFYGSFVEPPPGVEGIVDLGGGTTATVADVVAITPLDDGLWTRLSAFLDLGFTLAKSNWAMTLGGSGEVAYRGEDYGASFGFDSYVQSSVQNDESTLAVARNTLVLRGRRFYTPWEVGALLQFDQNDELQLKSRFSLGGGGGYQFIATNAMNLVVSAGLIGTRELYVDGSPTYNLDAFASATWEVFRYDTPKLDLAITGSIYPGLTDWGRVRGNSNVRVKYEVFSDFNVGISFSGTFDTRPPDPSAPKNDFLVSFTIGWKYRR
jgi:hypothetical protein